MTNYRFVWVGDIEVVTQWKGHESCENEPRNRDTYALHAIDLHFVMIDLPRTSWSLVDNIRKIPNKTSPTTLDSSFDVRQMLSSEVVARAPDNNLTCFYLQSASVLTLSFALVLRRFSFSSPDSVIGLFVRIVPFDPCITCFIHVFFPWFHH